MHVFCCYNPLHHQQNNQVNIKHSSRDFGQTLAIQLPSVPNTVSASHCLGIASGIVHRVATLSYHCRKCKSYDSFSIAVLHTLSAGLDTGTPTFQNHVPEQTKCTDMQCTERIVQAFTTTTSMPCSMLRNTTTYGPACSKEAPKWQEMPTALPAAVCWQATAAQQMLPRSFSVTATACRLPAGSSNKHDL